MITRRTFAGALAALPLVGLGSVGLVDYRSSPATLWVKHPGQPWVMEFHTSRIYLQNKFMRLLANGYRMDASHREVWPDA